ncbi:YbaB/EbfC family nucleoid-associated protein [Actinomadura rupiterrae]|uniref:YbaB/EbfC family nucleoid-associated protein n=1 Tax=Actinomadura rupiterrae TaxID=559627 RepID=UPI0020A4BF8B|nr:YbaB/EbfC family nucleoid-associated protein [Actinomadura rupiterrae]MCP2341986.1 DNA-binding protein YbaB [Actinomadura rupiterrae]
MTEPTEQRVGQVMASLQALQQRVLQVQDGLARKEVTFSDQSGVVQATCDGTGNLTAIDIKAVALSYPERLGEQISEAVAGVWLRSDKLQAKAHERYLSELPNPRSFVSLLSGEGSGRDYLSLGDYGSPKIRDSVAEYEERRRATLGVVSSLASRTVRQEIGSNVGMLEISLDRSWIRVAIRPEVPKQVGLERLAAQFVTAVHQAEVNAASNVRMLLEVANGRGV